MKRRVLCSMLISAVLASSLMLGGCAGKNADTDKKEKEEMTTQEDGSAEAIAQETSDVGGEITEADESEERIPTAKIEDSIPSKYTAYVLENPGTIEKISYTTYDYYGNGAEITKEANVYLPGGYDPSKKYNVLYLMHVIVGDENEWGMT